MKPQLASIALALAALTAGSAVQAQSTPQPTASPADSRSSQPPLEAMRAEIASLQAMTATLKDLIGDLQANNAALRKQVSNLQVEVGNLHTNEVTLQNQLAAVQSNHALALGPFVSVNPGPEVGVAGPNITFSGANVHIVSGSGATDDDGNSRGRGNLILGYDEGSPNPGDRSGSHNLVVGRYHRFTQTAFGGLVVGEANTVSKLGASVSGGSGNTASGFFASVTGGFRNTASNFNATVSGGQVNTASGRGASVGGGVRNTAGGLFTVVIGSQDVVNNDNFLIAPQAPFPTYP
ncbi:MAG TPA: hypothetical protein VGD78_17940 [Chthoniobacterales bacterium]